MAHYSLFLPNMPELTEITPEREKHTLLRNILSSLPDYRPFPLRSEQELTVILTETSRNEQNGNTQTSHFTA